VLCASIFTILYNEEQWAPFTAACTYDYHLSEMSYEVTLYKSGQPTSTTPGKLIGN